MTDGDAAPRRRRAVEVLADRIVDAKAAFPDEQHDAGRDELLADRSDLVDGVWRGGRAALAIGDAVAGDLHDLPVLQHRERQPRDLLPLHLGADVLVGPVDRRGRAACHKPCGVATGRAAVISAVAKSATRTRGVRRRVMVRAPKGSPNTAIRGRRRATGSRPAPSAARSPNSHCRSGRMAYSRRASIRDRGIGHETPRISCQAVLHSDGRM